MEGRHIRLPAVARRALACATAALALLSPTASHADCRLQAMTLPVKMVGDDAVATVGINGTQVPLVVDSGAFFSVLTEAAASQLNLRLRPMPEGMEVRGLVGKVRTHMTTVAHLQVGTSQIPEADFVVGGNEPGAGALGLMGRNILALADTEYDLAHGVIRLVVPNDDCDHADMAYWASPDTPVSELALEHDWNERLPELRATIELDGHKVSAVFDSGAGTVVSLRAAHRLGIKDSDMRPTDKAAGVGAGWADAWTAAFDKVDFGGEAIQHNRLQVIDFDMPQDMLIGIDFFLSHHIYVSKKQSRMFFTYNGGPVFALNHGDRDRHGAEATNADTLQADELARRGAASLSRGDLAGALADLDRACALQPDNAEFFAERARVHAAQEHADKALADLDTALRLDPAQDRARMERAGIRALRNERDPALQDLTELDKRLAPQSDLRRQVAILYDAFEMPALGMAQWNQWIPAHKHQIDADEAYNSRCWERVELGIELDQALDDCDEAVDGDSKNAAYLDSRAWAYLRLDKLKKSLADFDRALALKSDEVSSLYGRGLVHLRLGDAASGQADLAAARKIEPGVDASMKKSGLPVAPAP